MSNISTESLRAMSEAGNILARLALGQRESIVKLESRLGETDILDRQVRDLSHRNDKLKRRISELEEIIESNTKYLEFKPHDRGLRPIETYDKRVHVITGDGELKMDLDSSDVEWLNVLFYFICD
jgi:hypothetical protein